MQISIKVIPNSSKNQITGWFDKYLKIKIAAPAKKGKANKELVKFLAREWDIPKSNIQIIRGEKSTIKVLEATRLDINKLPPKKQIHLLESV